MPAKFRLTSYSKVSVGASQFQPNLAQLKVNGPWLTLLCFIAKAFDHSSRQPRRKLYHNLPLRLAQVNIPQFFEGCGWLAGFKTSWCLSTTRRRNSSITGPTKPAFHPSIHRSIDWSIEYAWASHIFLQVLLGLQRSFLSYFATRQVTLWLDLTKPLHIAKLSAMLGLVYGLFFIREWNGMEWNGLSHNIPAFAYPRFTVQLGLDKTG